MVDIYVDLVSLKCNIQLSSFIIFEAFLIPRYIIHQLNVIGNFAFTVRTYCLSWLSGDQHIEMSAAFRCMHLVESWL